MNQPLLKKEKRPFFTLPNLTPSEAISNTVAGLVVGGIDVFVEISIAAFIFSGEAASFLPLGIGLFLFGAASLTLFSALFSRIPGVFSPPQDEPSAILSVMLASIIATAPAGLSPEARFLTLFLAIVATSLLTGLFFFLLGKFRLGWVVRFVPYPIVGGFLAGTGWLLFRGSLEVMSDAALSWAMLPAFFTLPLLLKWVPGLALGLVLWAVLRRYSHFLLLPGMLITAVFLFFLTLFLSRTPIDTALAQGWFIGPFPDSGMWQPHLFSALKLADLSLVTAQAGNMGVIIVLATIAFLLNVTGLEFIVQREVDLNRELQTFGLINIVCGLGGSPAGYPSPSMSSLMHRLGTGHRLSGFVAGLVVGLPLIVGANALSLIPKFVVGGLLCFLGLSFLSEWLYDSWFKLTRSDYLLIVLIVLAIGLIGFLEGVLLGLVAAIILFVINYSRVNTIRTTLSGSSYHSRVRRPRLHQQLLAQKGHWIQMVELQGYLFFGTADAIFSQIRAYLNSQQAHGLRYIVVDFRLVTGFDASAVRTFGKLKQLVVQHEITLLFTQLSPSLQEQMAQADLMEDEQLRLFANLDQGVAWCEEQMIATFASTGMALRARTMKQQLETLLAAPTADSNFVNFLTQAEPSDERMTRLRDLLGADNKAKASPLAPYLKQQQHPADYVLIQQGAAPKGLFFLEQGQAQQVLADEKGGQQPLLTLEAGTVAGILGLYQRYEQEPVSVITTQPATGYFLSVEKLQQMEKEAPETAVVVHRFMIALLGEQLDALTNQLDQRL